MTPAQKTIDTLKRLSAKIKQGVPLEAVEVRRVDTPDGPMHIRRHVVLNTGETK